MGDAAKTAATFPVIDGVRYSVPGDRARHLADGAHRTARPRLGDHQLRRREDLRRGGRDGDRVAPGGGRRRRVGPAQRALGPGGRRGRALVDGATADAQELIDHAAGVIARYKLPKAVVFRPVIERSPAGKADYRWAREQALSEGRDDRARSDRAKSAPRRILRYSYTVIFTVPIAGRCPFEDAGDQAWIAQCWTSRPTKRPTSFVTPTPSSAQAARDQRRLLRQRHGLDEDARRLSARKPLRRACPSMR